MEFRRLPPEWAPQRGVLLTWPRDGGDWGDTDALTRVEATFAAIAAAISRRQAVIITCADTQVRASARRALEAAGAVVSRHVHCHIVASDDAWARDHGPITVCHDGQPLLLDFRFNGWGGKFPCARDDAITETLWRQEAFGQTRLETVDLVLEGGAIETDGRGTLLATRRSVLNPNRNPGWSESRISALLKRTLGITTIHWLSHGTLIGDDTDGHIDTLARFTDPGTLVYQSCSDPHDPHFEPLREMAAELRSLRDADGKPYTLKPLPLPAPVFDEHDERLPAGYANFLIINGAVLMPAYDDPADAVAADILATCFPRREVIPIDCRPLIHQHGSLHCVTMHLPRAAPRPPHSA